MSGVLDLSLDAEQFEAIVLFFYVYILAYSVPSTVMGTLPK